MYASTLTFTRPHYQYAARAAQEALGEITMVNMYRVAKEALPYVKKAYTDLLNKSRLSSTDAESGEFGLDDHELYLYVYDNGEWIIDRAKYLQNHRSIASTAWIADYSSIRDLAEELKQNRVWE